MSAYVKLAGAALLLIFSLYVGREYTRYVEKRLSALRGVIALVAYARGRIEGFLTPKEGLWRDFNNEADALAPFFALINEGVCPPDAFNMKKDDLPLSREAKKILADFFSALGRGYKESELLLCRKTEEALTRIYTLEEAELPKNAKAVRVILLAVSLGVMILLL